MKNEVDMLIALRRKKDKENQDYDVKCRRYIVCEDFPTCLEDFKHRIVEPGYWRIYTSVNARDLTKAMKILQVEMIVNGDSFKHKIDSKWKSILMQPKCKAEKYWLVDVDSKDLDLNYKIQKYLESVTTILEESTTPNGEHLVVHPFDLREFNKMMVDEPVEIKKDALLFLEAFTNAEK